MELPEITRLRGEVESLLLVADEPVSIDQLARATESDPAEIHRVITEIATEFEQRGSGIDLRSDGQGWRYYTRRDNAPVVEKLLLDGSQSRLSRAALETLAVVAYRQPVTRAQVAAVRGVNVDGVMRTLEQRGLLRRLGGDDDTEGTEGTALRFVTTQAFLDHLGIDSLDRLPDLAPLLPELDDIDDAF